MKKPELIRRQKALLKTQSRFQGKSFRLGSNDCLKLARFHLVAMGRKDLPSTGHYKTVAEAKRQLKKQGARNLRELLDKYLEPIAPAFILPGDLAMPPSDPQAPAHKLGTVMVAISPRKFLGWDDRVEALATMELLEIERAWRPWKRGAK